MALVTIRRSPSVQSTQNPDETGNAADNVDDEDGARSTKSLNECYFASKGAALVLGGTERTGGCTGTSGGAGRRRSPALAQPPPAQTQPDIQHHLQAMFYLLRPEETLKMAVKLESAHAGRTRYLVVVCRGEEAALLGIDCNERTTVGLVLRVLADTSIKLDGDGGFSVCVCGRQHIFKPVSVQAMWSALQTLHRSSGRAREFNHFAGGTSHSWALYYEERIDSDRSCLNEWHAMDSLESRRPPSPDSLRHKPRERDETERVIRCTLKEIMMSVDLDEVTSKAIRGRLEEELDMDLAEYKPFIDHEMLTILGQMDAPTEIFDHVYLGSEWNASNLEELQRNGVRHILNVTREIDNFFPGMFNYLNIRVYDDDKTDLLKHWDNTFKYINKARNDGSKVLVHCKMGISRSASVVIAYAMKAYNWNFDRALQHVKQKRSCIKPNTSFLNQLEMYEGILDANKNKEKLQRSKSETNLKSPNSSKNESKSMERARVIQALSSSCGGRPRSWSPDTKLASELLPPTSVSLENLASETRHMLMPCASGSYSVSPNQIMRLKEEGATSVKHIVQEIETASAGDRKDVNRRSLRLTFNNTVEGESVNDSKLSPVKMSNYKNVDKIPTWDPGEHKCEDNLSSDIVKCDSGVIDLNSKSKASDNYSNLMDEDAPSRQSSWSSFDSAVVPDLSRQSSWGSYDTRSVKIQTDSANKKPKDFKKEEEMSEIALPHKIASDLSIISENCENNNRRIKIDISDNEKKFNETCAILKELESCNVSRREASTWCGRLSASAPTESWLQVGIRRRWPVSASYGDLSRATSHPPLHPPRTSRASASTSGLVRNLKKEFEARSNSSKPDDDMDLQKKPNRLKNCLPVEKKLDESSEDLSVRFLVGKYDSCKPSCDVSKLGRRSYELVKKCKLSSDCEPKRMGPGSILRNSFCGVIRSAGSSERPPMAPNVVSMAPMNFPDMVVATVMTKAQNKKQLQHGKTHPLTRLNINRSSNRCSNAVYNTM